MDQNFSKITIFVVDDDDTDIMVIKRSFQKAGIENPVMVAHDGAEALDLLHSGAVPRPFIILLDLNMPVMDGHECLEEIRKDPDLMDSVVFILTSSNSEEDKARAYQNNVAGYLLKEFAGEDIKNVAAMLQSYWQAVQMPPIRTSE